MSLVPTKDQEKLLFQFDGGTCSTIIGLPLMAFGSLVVLAYLVDKSENAPPLLVTLLFGVGFGVAGAALAFGKEQVTVDRGLGLVTSSSTILGLGKKQSFKLSSYERVVIAKQIRRQTVVFYPVSLEGESAEKIVLASYPTKDESVSIANKVAEFLSLKVVDRVDEA